MISIKEIAKLANVAQSTVSKALNDKPDVSPVTKRKIIEIAKQYDFVPNAFGKGLKSRTTENIGIIFCREAQPLSGNPFYSRVLEGIEAELVINNYNLVLQLIPDSQQNILPKMVRQRQVDGLILAGSFREQFIQSISSNDINVVLVDPKITINSCSQVLIDNEHGGFIATQYLIQLIRTGGLENGYEHVNSLLISEKRPTAIFAANDINAIHGYKAILDNNLKIPDDISVIGFDDIDLAKYSTPSLTTVRVYKEELGSIAVRMLLKIINRDINVPITTIVPIKLIERNSVNALGNGKNENQ